MRVPRLIPILGLLPTAVLLAATRAFAQGCAMCGSSVTPDDPLAKALNASVLFLMATPYTLVGSVALWLFVQHRRRSPRSGGAVIALPRAHRSADPKEE